MPQDVPVTLARVTAYEDWLESLGKGLSMIEQARNNLDSWSADEIRTRLDPGYNFIHEARDEIDRARRDETRIKESLEVMKVNAEFRETILRARPKGDLPGRLSFLGAGLLGAGSGAFVLVGLLPSLVLWVSGLVLLFGGLVATRYEDMERREAYEKQFIPQEEQD